MSGQTAALEVEGVTKRFGAVTALRDVSLQLHGGQVLGLIGDNGAGKSTLVGVVSGAIRPDEGQIRVDGVERSFSDPAEARAVGIETVFQNLALDPTLNITENLFLRRERLGPGARAGCSIASTRLRCGARLARPSSGWASRCRRCARR